MLFLISFQFIHRRQDLSFEPRAHRFGNLLASLPWRTPAPTAAFQVPGVHMGAGDLTSDLRS